MPYNPAHDRVTDREVLADFIGRHPLATLVTHDGTAPDADMVPLLLRGDELIGHVARANPLWHEGRQRGPVLAVFGPVEHYVSPSWYPSKAEHHRVVPTWNYAVVHARGDLVVHDDPKWVRQVVARLTAAMESPRDEPWRMGMAPGAYLDDMIEQVVGISIRIGDLVGRFKLNAAKSEADRLGSARGVREDPGGRGAAELADLMTDPPPSAVGG